MHASDVADAIGATLTDPIADHRPTSGSSPTKRRGVPRRRARSLTGVVAVVAVTALAAAGCRQPQVDAASEPPSRVNTGVVESAEKPVLGGSVAYALASETNGWNPLTNQWGPSGWMVARSIFDTLAAYDDQSQLRPYFATAIDHNADFTTWTFTIRTGVKFSNGKPVTAEAIATAQRMLASSPVVGPSYAWVKKSATGAPMIDAQGEDKIVYTMIKPYTTFPNTLAAQVGTVTDPDWLATNDGISPVGTGPFRLESWAIGKDLDVKKNPDYWQIDKWGNRYPYLDTIKFRIINEGSSRANALDAGDVDAIEVIEPALIKQFQGSTQYQTFTNSNAEMFESYVQLNFKKAPFDDITARKAVAYATDQQGFVDVTAAGAFEVADGPFATNSPWYSDTGYVGYDVNKAKDLVDKYKADHGGNTISFTLIGSSSSSAALQLLQSMYTTVGMDVKVEMVEAATTAIKAVTGDYQGMLFGGWFYQNPDTDLLFVNTEFAPDPPTFAMNFTRNSNPKIREEIDRFRSTEDKATQKQSMGDIVRTLNEDGGFVWLLHAQVGVVASRKLVNLINYTLPDGAKGLDMSQGAHPMYQVWLTS